MKHYLSFFISLCLVFTLTACSPGTYSALSVTNTDPTVPSTSFHAPTPDTALDPDTVLDIASLSMAELEAQYGDAYILMIPDTDSTILYRIWIREDRTAPLKGTLFPLIDQYKTSPISPDFFTGASVTVHSATQNTINEADYGVFGTRYHVQPGKINVASAQDAWGTGDTILIFCPDDGTFLPLSTSLLTSGNLDADSTDAGLVQLMLLLYADRGTGIQHFP